MVKENQILLPYPKKVNFYDGRYILRNEGKICFPSEAKEKLFPIAKRLKEIIKQAAGVDTEILADNKGDISFVYDKQLGSEAYIINISKETIGINYCDYAGAFYAVSTLKQLFYQYGKVLPAVRIEDKPDYKRRGIMVDISRDKIPTMETLYRIVDFMADIKLNELQLYIEGFSFAYPSFPHVWADGTPIKPEEIMLLDIYCKERYIDLVANQNSFGHMSAWLHRKEYEHLADCPEGCLTPWGSFIKSSTLNPLDKGSIELVKKQYEDLLPNFTSEYFNVGLDEPFELGHGKSKEETDRLGTGRVYLDYLLKIYDEVKRKNKRMMFWGDIIIKSPELIPELPKDIIALEWGYEGNHPFEQNCEKYEKAGLEFYVCPGTSSWNSILGRTENMMQNLLNAAESGFKHGAIGFLNTDWGDNGHIQYLPVSYPGFCYGAALCWGLEQNKNIDLVSYLNKFIFKDKNELVGQLAMDLGNYCLRETVQGVNSTKLFWVLNNSVKDTNVARDLVLEDYKKLEEFMTDLDNKMDDTNMTCEDSDIIYKEFKNGIRYVLHGIKRVRLMLCDYSNKENYLKLLDEDIKVIMKNHTELWLKRNREGVLEQSLDYMRRLMEQYE